jgi:hypothetical protein
VIRDSVSFRHPAPFVSLPDQDQILSTAGAAWFRDLLKRVPMLLVDDDLCQEDWGVVIFAERHRSRFWIGLSLGPDGDPGSWLAHAHHASFAWLQRLSRRGKQDLTSLMTDIHTMLSSEPLVTNVRWFNGADLDHPGSADTSSDEPIA